MDAPFHGTGTALATPFAPDRSIDFDALGRLIDMQIDNGVEALVPCGSTGESATLERSEKLEVIRFTVEHVRQRSDAPNRPKVVAGTGSNVTADTASLTEDAARLGVDAALVVGPYYNKPSQQGILEHYGTVAKAVPELPIVLYNVPGRTGSNIAAETQIELAVRHENIVATKEASGDLDQCSRIIRDAPQGFVLYSGEDSLTLPLLAVGAQGVIAVVANEAPAEFGRMVRAALGGDFETARRIHLRLSSLMQLNFVESNPVPVKAALALMGVFDGAHYRLPLVPLADSNRVRLQAELQILGLIESIEV